MKSHGAEAKLGRGSLQLLEVLGLVERVKVHAGFGGGLALIEKMRDEGALGGDFEFGIGLRGHGIVGEEGGGGVVGVGGYMASRDVGKAKR